MTGPAVTFAFCLLVRPEWRWQVEPGGCNPVFQGVRDFIGEGNPGRRRNRCEFVQAGWILNGTIHQLNLRPRSSMTVYCTNMVLLLMPLASGVSGCLPNQMHPRQGFGTCSKGSTMPKPGRTYGKSTGLTNGWYPGSQPTSARMLIGRKRLSNCCEGSISG